MKNLFNVKATSVTKWDGYKDTMDGLDRATAKALTELEGMVKADLDSLPVSILQSVQEISEERQEAMGKVDLNSISVSILQSVQEIIEERQEAIEAMKKASEALLEAYHSVMDIEAL